MLMQIHSRILMQIRLPILKVTLTLTLTQIPTVTEMRKVTLKQIQMPILTVTD
jgi:hypothetical protein